MDLTLQNEALLLKQLDKFYKEKDVQWVHLIWNKYYSSGVPHLRKEKGPFWWKDILRLHVKYRGVTICNPGNGDTISFWDDLLLGNIMSLKFPNLYDFTKDAAISLEKVLGTSNLVDTFRIPMSRQAFNELQILEDDVSSLIDASSQEKGSMSFIWGNNIYSANRYYHHHFSSITTPVPISWLWKSKCVPRIKFFTWFLLNDRLTHEICSEEGRNTYKKDTIVQSVMRMLKKLLIIFSLNAHWLLANGRL